jgi:hypothetical protein
MFSVKHDMKIYIQCKFMLWVRRLVAGLSSRKSRFDAGRECVKFLQIFLLVLRLFQVSTIPPVLYLHLHVAVIRRRKSPSEALVRNVLPLESWKVKLNIYFNT